MIILAPNSQLEHLLSLSNVRFINRTTFIFSAFFICLLFSASIFGQNTTLNGVRFESQNQIDDFDTTISIINGDIIISQVGLDTIVSLNNLINIKEVKGDILISYNWGLKTLNGLDSVKHLSGFLYIGTNDLDWNMGNTSLIDFCAISGLAQTLDEDKIQIKNNVYNPTLNDFINGDCSITLPDSIYLGSILLRSQEQINSFNPKIKHITGSLTLEDFYGQINNLHGLENIKYINKDLDISFVHNLETLEGLNNLDSIGGALILCPSEVFRSFSGLDKLKRIGESLNVENNTALDNFQGLENLISIRGVLNVHMSGINSFSGLDNLKELGALILMDNNNLETLNGLENIELLFTIDIFGNQNLKTLKGLNNLKEIIGPFYLIYNNELTDLNGLNKLERIDLDVNISDNENLISLNGLENLNRVDMLDIVNNTSLVSLEGLSNLKTIVYDLTIGECPKLRNLQGLNNLSYIGYNVFIGEQWNGSPLANESLSDFCAILDLIISINEDKMHISNNKYNPSYNDFLNGNCKDTISSITEYSRLNFHVWPNPSSDFINIKIPESITGDYNMEIFDISGKCIFKQIEIYNSQINLDISHIQKGLYILSLTYDNNSYRSLFTKE